MSGLTRPIGDHSFLHNLDSTVRKRSHDKSTANDEEENQASASMTTVHVATFDHQHHFLQKLEQHLIKRSRENSKANKEQKQQAAAIPMAPALSPLIQPAFATAAAISDHRQQQPILAQQNEKSNTSSVNGEKSDSSVHIHRSEIGSYDVLLIRRSLSNDSSDSNTIFCVDTFSSHVGNTRFSVMMTMYQQQQQQDEDGVDIDIATRIVNTLYKECKGRFLHPIADDGLLYCDIGADTRAIDMVRKLLSSSSSLSPSTSTSDSESPSSSSGTKHSSLLQTEGNHEISFHLMSMDHTNQNNNNNNNNNSNKRPRRSSPEPSSYDIDSHALIKNDRSQPLSSINLSVPISKSEITKSDVLLCNSHTIMTHNSNKSRKGSNKGYLRPTNNIGNNRLRVMITLASARYSKAILSQDYAEAANIAEDIVRRVKKADDDGNVAVGRFLDDDIAFYDMYVEVSHETAVHMIRACLDDAVGINDASSDSNSSKVGTANKALIQASVPVINMQEDISSLRRDAAQDMLKKKRGVVDASKGGGKNHGGAKGFSSKLQHYQIMQVQDEIRRIVQADDGDTDACIAAEPPSSSKTKSLFDMDGPIRRLPAARRSRFVQTKAKAANELSPRSESLASRVALRRVSSSYSLRALR